MKFSKYQEAIFNWIKTGKGHAIIQAVAGSGKTTTLIESMKLISGYCVFLAFNKAIADELTKKVPKHVKACTLHSLGFQAIRNNLGSVKVETNKIDKIMDTIQGLMPFRGMPITERQFVNSQRAQIKKLVSLVKMSLIDYTNSQAIAETAEFYGIEYDTIIMPMFRRVFEKSIADKSMIDFDDMIYYPVIMKMNMPKFDWIFVDESQDLNRVQIELVLSIVKNTGRVVAVGDSKQSIYGFRGADSEAMSRIKQALDATELPLSICYRCPKSHIELAKEIVPQIEASPDAIDGIINNIKEDNFETEIIKENNPLVLCRVNAPLMSMALSLISQGYKATIKGTDLGKALLSIINKIDGNDIESVYQGIRNWEAKEITKLNRKEAPESLIDNVRDKAATLTAVADNCDSKQCVVNKIYKLFTDDKADGIEFSSVHKAKGLEADSVFIVKPNLLPLIRKNQKDWELDQEMNIKYVALTRSKNKLTFVKSNKE
jgi:superfamily I DNA/RNA helicase